VVCDVAGTPTSGVFTYSKAISCLKSAEIANMANELKVYPNPFTEKLTFEFVSGKDGNATLELVNIVGQKISTLWNGEVKSGVTNSVEFIPQNLKSGVLIYRLNIDGEVQTGKVIYKN
jgi:hypothetical protein